MRLAAACFGDKFRADVFRGRVAEELANDEGGLELDIGSGELQAVIRAGREWLAKCVDAEVCEEGGRDGVAVQNAGGSVFEPLCDFAARGWHS